MRLSVAGRLVVMIVEASFANGDYLWVLAQIDEFLRRDIQFFVSIVRMGANRAVNTVIALRHGEHLLKPPNPGADRDHTFHAHVTGTLHDIIEFVRKVWKIQVAIINPAIPTESSIRL